MTTSHHARGFVMLSAILTMAIVAGAILALASVTSYDGRRTMNAWQQAQLQQLLLAGAQDALERLNGAGATAGQSWAPALPEDLSAEGASLRVTVISNADQAAEVKVMASWLDRSREQTLRFKQVKSKWILVSAELS
jgi:Tfp pilus assembly protein PilE